MRALALSAAFAAGTLALASTVGAGAPPQAAQSGTATGSFLTGGMDPSASGTIVQDSRKDPVQRTLGVTFYVGNAQESVFNNACGNPLTLEDFEDCGNGIIGCPGAPFDHNTNNACFPNGCIAQGLIVDALNNHQVYIGPAGFFGSTSKFIGADFFVDSFDVKFQPVVIAASLKAHLIFNGGSVVVNAYGADCTTIIGTTTMTANPDPGTFIGAIANGSDLLCRLNFFNAGNNSEGGDDIRFGFCGPYCGDGNVDTPNGQGVNEECDDGNNIDGDHCSAQCTIELFCGDAIVNQDCEACDDGNNISGDGCSCDCIEEGGGGGDACEIVRLLLPVLPGKPELSSTHPCFEPPPPVNGGGANRKR